MFVTCTADYPNCTKDKLYEIIDDLDYHYLIEDDTNDVIYAPKHLFREVDVSSNLNL